MSGPFDFIRNQLHRRSVKKKLRQARDWPIATGEVNHWEVKPATSDVLTSATPYQIEARFHFSVNGEYYGGYFRSVGLGLHAAETAAQGAPAFNVRYDPANPDSTVVLPEDNTNLPFRISTGA
jgi:hypothetical protein